MMACAPDDPQPYTLWFDTLPSDDTARLLIWPCASEVRVVLFWNGDVHAQRIFATIETAEDWVYRLHRALEQDALTSALLGCCSKHPRCRPRLLRGQCTVLRADVKGALSCSPSGILRCDS